MTAPPPFAVIPRHQCMCHGTGWITRVEPNGDAYDIPCPNGCPMPELPPVHPGDPP